MKYYCDGFSIKQNPSPIGGGFTVVREDNLLVSFRRLFKKDFTSNEAELLGILEALKIANTEDSISTDSRIVLSWILNSKNPKENRSRKDLDSIKRECLSLVESKNIVLMWESRESNLAGLWNEKNSKKI